MARVTMRLAAGVLALLLLVLGPPPAAALTAHLVTDASLANRTPGTDLRIGTADDGTATAAIPPSGSGPNTSGAASFALLRSSAPVPADATDFDYILFVEGTIEFTPDYTASTAANLVLAVTGGTLTSTAEFNHPTRGPATTPLTGNTASFDPTTGAGSVVLTGTFTPSTAPAFALDGQTLTAAPGDAWVVLPAQFGSVGGYVQDVLVPLVPASTTAIVLVEFTGTVSGTPCCDGFTTRGVLAAYTTDDLGCEAVFPDLCSGGASCQTFDECATALAAALPDPKAVPKSGRKTAKQLGKLAKKAGRSLARAQTASGKKQTRFYRRARNGYGKLAKKAENADRKGRLGVTLSVIEALVARLRELIPL